MLELFIARGETGSARVLEVIEDHGISESIRSRDVSDPAASERLRALGGSTTPALWDGEELHSGAEAVLARIRAFLDVGRTD